MKYNQDKKVTTPLSNRRGGGGEAFYSFVIKETRHILRDKRTMLILFGMPVVLMLLFGFAITNDVKNVRTVVVTSQMDHQTQAAVNRLAASEYFTIITTVPTPRDAEMMIRSQKADISLTPKPHPQPHSRASSGMGSGYTWQIMVDGSDPNMAQQWTAYAQAILSQPISGKKYILPSPIGMGPGVRLLYNPRMKSAYNFVPAIMGMLLLLICAMMTSVSIVREKEQGTMEVLLVSPVRPLMIIVAKAVPYLVQALIILVIILVMSATVLDVPLQGSVGWIMVVSLIYIMLALSLGLLISNIAKTQFVALLVSAMVLLLPTVMLSGMLFPVESMPVILQWISAVIPPRYYIEAMRKLMIMGVGIEQVWREVAVLAGMTALLLVVSLKKFKQRL
ncbi:MAG: ABC transporter permease [Prevotella sp.]|nr:ABC transporter permease [Prevotella sp.]